MDQEPLLFIIILIFQTFNIKCNNKWAWLSIHCICNLQLLHLNLDLTIWFTISDNKIFVLLKFIDRLLSNHLFNLLFADVINFRNYCKSSLVQKNKQTNKKHKKQKTFVSTTNNTHFNNVDVWQYEKNWPQHWPLGDSTSKFQTWQHLLAYLHHLLPSRELHSQFIN